MANYEIYEIEVGDTYQNNANTRKVEILESTYWAAGRYNSFGYVVRITEKNFTYNDKLTRQQIAQRFPVKAANAVSAIEAEIAELEAKLAELKGRLVKVAA